MSALDEFADNVNDIVASHNARFQKLNDAKRALQVKGNDIADRWEQYFTEEAKKLQVANDALAAKAKAQIYQSNGSNLTLYNQLKAAGYFRDKSVAKNFLKEAAAGPTESAAEEQQYLDKDLEYEGKSP